MIAIARLKRRVEALEAKVGGDSIGLEAIIHYSMNPHLYDAETERRIKESRLYRLILESAARGSEPQGRAMDAQESERPPASIVGPANGIPLEHLVAYRDHPPSR
jgi:hypothetical protein